MKIENASREEYPAIVDLWEASVRATHEFLPEEDILYFKPLILNEYLDAVELKVARDIDGRIAGFLGVAEQKVEMLFIDPERRRQGIGSLLLGYAIDELGALAVDVNEQNPDAVGFYERSGFAVIGRSPLDGQGKPYPILHMALER